MSSFSGSTVDFNTFYVTKYDKCINHKKSSHAIIEESERLIPGGSFKILTSASTGFVLNPHAGAEPAIIVTVTQAAPPSPKVNTVHVPRWNEQWPYITPGRPEEKKKDRFGFIDRAVLSPSEKWFQEIDPSLHFTTTKHKSPHIFLHF